MDAHDHQDRVLFGAGWRGERMAEGLAFLNWSGIIDRDKDKTGKKLKGITISALENVCKDYSDPVVVVANKDGFFDIREELVGYGVDKENIIFFGDKYTDIISRQYFDLKELPHVEDEVFVDCGAYGAETSVDFIKWSANKYKKIYCFEPDGENCEECRRNLLEHGEPKQFEIINKGLWNESRRLSFISDGHISAINETGDRYIEVAALDDVLSGEQVTFIKMDIEGAELKAIDGAAETIRRCKPKLAIAVYHKGEDITEIPGKILQICGDYVFYLRHYHVIASETVLYAIPTGK